MNREMPAPEGLSEAILVAARNARIGVVVTVREGDVLRNVWVSLVAGEILGRPVAEILAGSSLEFIAPEELPRIAAMSAARVRGEPQPVAFETLFLRGDGTPVAVEVALCLLELRGKPATVTFFTDITQRRATEQALRDSETRLRRVVDSAPDAIVITRDERVLFANPAAISMLGFERSEQMIGMPLTVIVKPEDLPIMRARMRRAAELGESSVPREYLLQRHDGGEIRMEISSHAIEYDGAPALLAFGRDVSERVKMQEQLARADRLAALGTLAAGVAHEINNPLAFVTLGIDTLEAHLRRSISDPALRDDLMARLEPIRTGATRVAEIVRDLKSFSRVDEPAARDIDVAAVIRSAERIAAHEVRRRARLTVSVEGSPRGHGHPGRLEQVVVNLLVNAAHAFPDEGPEGTVAVRCSERDGWIVIEVEDDGQGIPPEVAERVFEPFFTTKPTGVGTGLGLPICNSIVTGMGGTIVLESEVGRGTRVRVRIPSAVREEPVEVAPAPRRLEVLVVDDEPALARMLELLLGRDHDVVFAGDGVEALERLAQRRVDVVLCDVMMPRMGGRELHAQVAATDPALAERFVFMTGGAIDAETERWLESIDSPRLWKPFSYESLVEAVRRAAVPASEAPAAEPSPGAPGVDGARGPGA